MAQPSSKPGLITRLLRALGIGKRPPQREPERYAGEPPRTSAVEKSASGGDQRSTGSAQPVPPPLPVNPKPASDPAAATASSSDSPRSDTDKSIPSIDDAETTEIAAGVAGQSPVQDLQDGSNPPDAEIALSAGREDSDGVLMRQQIDQSIAPQGQTMHTPATMHGGQTGEHFGALLADADNRGVDVAPAQVDSSSSTSTDGGTPGSADDGRTGDEGQSHSRPASNASGSPRSVTIGLTSTDAAVEQRTGNPGAETPAASPSEINSGNAIQDGAGSGHSEPGQGTRRLEAPSHSIWFEPGRPAEMSRRYGEPPEWLASDPEGAQVPEAPSGQSRDVAERPYGQKPERSVSVEPQQVQSRPDSDELEPEVPEPESTPKANRPEVGLRGSAASSQSPVPQRGVVDSGLGGSRLAAASGLAAEDAGVASQGVGSPAAEVGPPPEVTGLAVEALGLASEGAGLAPEEMGLAPEMEGLTSQVAGLPLEQARLTSQGAGPPAADAGLHPDLAGLSPETAGPAPEETGAGQRTDGPESAELDQTLPRVGLESTEPGGDRLRSGESEAKPALGDVEDVPPGLEPGLQEIVRRLVSPAGSSAAQRPMDGGRPANTAHADGDDGVSAGERDAEGETLAVEGQGDRQSEAVQRPLGTSANSPHKENISPARSASKRGRGRMRQRSSPGGKRRLNVSRETLSFGEVAGNVGEDEVMEDEAAIAVREAALRAAAEVPGANDPGQRNTPADPQDDVSRETSRSQLEASGGSSSETQIVEESSSLPKEGAPKVDIERAARDARVTFRIAHGAYNRFVIAVANQKGGVGKSTTAVNLGAYLALAGARVLVVDLDPQGNASTGLGLDHRQIEPSIYDVLMGDSDAASAIRQTPVRNLDVLPSTIDLAGAEVELVNAFSRETRLRQALGAVRYGYDFVFIDCPPSLGLLTVNALAAADELLIPIQCEYYALEGLGQLLRNVDLVRVNLNQVLHIGGIVLTMYDGRTRLAEQVVQEVRKHFTDLVYQTVVPRSVRLSESPGYGVPIALYDPLSRGGIAYRDLALELADRTGLLAPTREGAN
jgi:chromosome partitioning protein